jgi:glycosyltransferase involved in cell wall biosynthesis
MVLCDFQAGGAENTALRLVGALSRDGFSFTAAGVKPGGVLADAFVRAGADVIDGLARRRLDLLAPVRVAATIRRRGIEAVIVVDVARNAMFHALAGAALSCRKLLRICWCHSPLGGQGGWFAGRLRRYLALRRLDAIICTSRLQRQSLIDSGLPRRRTMIIRNGVDLPALASPPRCNLAMPEGKRIIVQVANLMPDKDYGTLLAAASRLAQDRSDWHLLLVGRGTDSPPMRDAVGRAGLAGRVTLAGYRDDVPSILGASDIFVLSTRCEAFSAATLEAMGAKLPVVVSDIPAFDEMFTHEREGLKVLPGRADALAAALARLLDDEHLRRALAAQAARRAQRFSLDRMAGAMARLLRAGRGGK